MYQKPTLTAILMPTATSCCTPTITWDGGVPDVEWRCPPIQIPE